MNEPSTLHDPPEAAVDIVARAFPHAGMPNRRAARDALRQLSEAGYVLAKFIDVED